MIKSNLGSMVSMEQLKAYLHAKHWVEDGKVRDVATVWHQKDDKFAEAEVILPFPNAKDYQQRLNDALSALASFAGCEVIDIINEIKKLFFNVISVRVIHADTSDGTIPINDGVLLISKAKELLLAAAQSMYAKKKTHTGPAPKEAKSYLDNLLLGQTEIGSYIVNVIAPVYENNIAEQVTTPNIPLAQAITHSLATGLDALKIASATYEESGDIKVFDIAILSGASANMCDALLGFSGENHNRTFEISISISASPLFVNELKQFQFDLKNVEVLEKAKNYYKDDYIIYQRTLIGHIRKLSRLKDEISGTVTLQTQVDGVERNIQLELSGDDYHLAVLAHDNSELVKINGDVHIKSKRSRLLNPSSFGVIKNVELF